jgi:hypothetical protein
VDLHHLLLAGLPAHFESYMASHAVGSLWLDARYVVARRSGQFRRDSIGGASRTFSASPAVSRSPGAIGLLYPVVVGRSIAPSQHAAKIGLVIFSAAVASGPGCDRGRADPTDRSARGEVRQFSVMPRTYPRPDFCGFNPHEGNWVPRETSCRPLP